VSIKDSGMIWEGERVSYGKSQGMLLNTEDDDDLLTINQEKNEKKEKPSTHQHNTTPSSLSLSVHPPYMLCCAMNE